MMPPNASGNGDHRVAPATPSARDATRRRGAWFWPMAVVGLIALNMSIVGITVYAANSDRSFAIEPDYYQKALAWDDTARQNEVNTALGWTAAAEIVPAQDGAPPELRIVLLDRSGDPIADAALDVSAFAKSRASERVSLVLGQREPGMYAAPIAPPRHGYWQVRVRAQAGDTLFTSQHIVFVPESPSPR